MEIRKLMLAILSVLPLFFTIDGMAKESSEKKLVPGEATTSSITNDTDEKQHRFTYEYGTALTPLGAEKAGNENGTIPPWTGGITSPPRGYKKGDHHPDSYPEDKILFTIDNTNLETYKDKLSPGQIALMKKYPSFRMNVYPARRSASFPQRIYDAIVANSKTAKLADNANDVSAQLAVYLFLPLKTAMRRYGIIFCATGVRQYHSSTIRLQ